MIGKWGARILTHISRIDARGVGAKFHSYLSSLTTQTVKSVVGNFGEKCGAKDVKKYYSKFDVAVVVELDS